MAEGGQPTSSDQTEETNNTVRLCTHLESVKSTVHDINKSLREKIKTLEDANDVNNCALHHCTIDVTDLLKKMETMKRLQEKLKRKAVEHIDHHRERSVRPSQQREEDRWNYFNRNSTTGNVLVRCGCNDHRCRVSVDSGIGSYPQRRLNFTNEELNRSALRETNITDLDPLSLTERLDAMNDLNLHSSESLQQQQHQQQQRVATECDDTASKFMARE